MCRKLESELVVGECKYNRLSNNHSLQRPIRLAAGSATAIRYLSRLLPPLPIQTPSDCDSGDLEIRISTDAAEEPMRWFFRFAKNGPSGNLLPIEAIQDVPLLSDRVLAKMQLEGCLTAEEYRRASQFDAADRYHVIMFPDYDGPTVGRFTIKTDDRIFLKEIASRWSEILERHVTQAAGKV